MSRNPFGWSLPPGVTDRMIDEAAGAFDDEQRYAVEDDGRPPECTGDCDRCPAGQQWVTADEDNGGDGRSYCQWCGADGDA